MKKLLASVAVALASCSPAMAMLEVPQGCIDLEYYDDMLYYGDLQMLEPADFDNPVPTDLVMDSEGAFHYAIYENGNVCIFLEESILHNFIGPESEWELTPEQIRGN